MSSQPPLMFAYSQGRLYRFVISERFGSSYFGGPLDGSITGKSFGPAPLHHIATIGSNEIPILRHCSTGLPLIYGMRYSGCTLRYAVGFETLKILEIEPTKSDPKWPYRNYPQYLPYLQLELDNVTRCTWRKFVDQLNDGPDEAPADLVVVVPPPTNLGMSLWGRAGDLENVQLIWEFNQATHEVLAYNVCS